MAAGDFSASALLNVQAEVSSVFQGGSVNNIYDQPVETAKAVLANQTMRAVPVMEGERCVSWKLYYVTDSATDVDYNSTSKDGDLSGCDLPSGNELESAAVTYSPNVFMHHTVTVDDNLCGNEYDFADLTSKAFMRAMNLMRINLNQRIITHLNSNAWATPSVGSTDYTVTSSAIQVPSADFNQDLVAKMYEIALINRIRNFRVASGTNLFQNVFNAGYNALNDSQRDQLAKYNFLGNVSFDLLDMDTVLGTNSHFLYDPDMVGFHNVGKAELNIKAQDGTMVDYTPKLIDAKSGIYYFLFDDPVLEYNRNGQLVPVTYLVKYQKVCQTATDALMQPVYNHRYTFQLVGGVQHAPTPSNQTNVLKFTKLAEV